LRVADLGVALGEVLLDLWAAAAKTMTKM
jgi:hypothetical protein